MIIVVAVFGILAAIAVPRFGGFVERAVKVICEFNRKAIESLNTVFLSENEGIEATFDQFLIENFDDVCLSGGLNNYVNGNIKFIVQMDDEDRVEEPPGQEVPLS